ncbi:MAG TPA: hydrogenase maturation nickel metallochaperone HypA [Salinivirga sp.]|uniref:hydrogenase maturation nickel metallochaperone HypA n=1 Tax=Salinivirga sp. TaxID=1970192 RepID=UPI002B47A0A6|nr:hydrogenase maturation nickel metallochaperone HypA [Salinivirga sp.]HKK58798.1 hydrogenase maturation nickel metallochaperone HypA [Salinivirga sp.]
MHEIAIVENTFKIILEVARREKLSKIRRVNFLIGEMHAIVPGIFHHAFESAALNTIAENAELNLEIEPIKMRCRQCGHEFIIKDSEYKCNECKSYDLDLQSGKELTIKSIEGE